jgi:hypothetical protein
MGKYLIGMGFLAAGRTRSRPEIDFFPCFPCLAGKTGHRAKALGPGDETENLAALGWNISAADLAGSMLSSPGMAA